jgi:hypothetical protein
MRLLLDKHLLLWAVNDPEKLGGTTRDLIENPVQHCEHFYWLRQSPNPSISTQWIANSYPSRHLTRVGAETGN